MQQDVIKIAKENNIKELFKPIKKVINGSRVFLSQNYVIKFFEGEKKKYFKNECLIYNKLDSDIRPILIKTGEIYEKKYILTTRLKGETLYSVWNKLNYIEQDNCIYQIANILKKISKIKNVEIIDFKKELMLAFNSNMRVIFLSDEYKNKINKFFYYTIQFISSKEYGYLTYIDNHFDNFIYCDGKIKVIDFEALKIAPLDFQMDRWCRMERHPKIYANNIEKNHIKKLDFINITNIMKKYYKEAFSYYHQNDRLHLYSLIYNLDVMKKHNIDQKKMIKFFNEDFCF